MNPYDVMIIGAGASGLMCASEAASRGRKVLLLDHEPKPGRKILASGGGRCNFTNLHTASDRYVGENPDFVKAAFARFKPKDFVKRVQARRIPFHEKQDGQLFCDRGSRDILHMLTEDAQDTGVTMELGRKIEAVEREGETFKVTTDRGTVSRRFVLARVGCHGPGVSFGPPVRVERSGTVSGFGGLRVS
jgi:predicted Rossmann fold flavoprotein